MMNTLTKYEVKEWQVDITDLEKVLDIDLVSHPFSIGRHLKCSSSAYKSVLQRSGIAQLTVIHTYLTLKISPYFGY